jgi:uncharacterized protein
MIHPDTELRFIHPEIGFGVVATRLIPKGTITWAQDVLDQVFTASRLGSLDCLFQETLHKYSFINGRAEYVLCWDLARYVNLSCHPTFLSAGYNFDMAVRDIQPGEELTDDYATLNLEGGFDCHCRVQRCRTTVSRDDIYHQADRWDSIVHEAFPLIEKVPQPLWPLVEEKEAVLAVLAGTSAIVSCKVNLRGFRRDSVTA